MFPRNLLAVPVLVLSALLLSACTDSPATPAQNPTSTLRAGHGYIAGAEEVQEPPLHLLTLGADGSIDQLDLLDESWTKLGTVNNVTDAVTDGRFVFTSDGASGTVSVIDSGMWTRDHEDHFHYYRSTPRMVGSIEGTGPASISVGSSATGVFFAESGEAVVLDNAALGEGTIVETHRIDGQPHAGSVVQLGASTLVTEGKDGIPAVVRVLDGEGKAASGDATCSNAGAPISTSVGVAYPCADDVLIATTGAQGVDFERVSYPDSTVPPARAFAARENRPSVAGLAGDQGIWLLDTRELTLTLLPTAVPLRQVTAVDDSDGHILGLTGDGRVTVISAQDGSTLSTTEPLLPETIQNVNLLAGVDLVVDQQRAYLNAPAERLLVEIDFADSGRIARTFVTPNIPLFFAETGR